MRALIPSAALILASALVAPAALAHGGEGPTLKEVPPAAPGDGQAAEKLIGEIEARAAKDPALAKVVAEAIESAKKALQRAHGMRASGDDAHARMVDGVALEWAQAADALGEAARAEAAALAKMKKAQDTSERAERARALLEETQARKARAAAELEKVQADAKDAAKNAADAEARRLEAGKRGGKAAPAKKGSKK